MLYKAHIRGLNVSLTELSERLDRLREMQLEEAGRWQALPDRIAVLEEYQAILAANAAFEAYPESPQEAILAANAVLQVFRESLSQIRLGVSAAEAAKIAAE